MKKYLNLALLYAIAAMIGGVYYRALTKWVAFSGDTMLGKVHAHLFVLGMLVFLLVALCVRLLPLEKEKTFRVFMVVYNLGLPLTTIMMVVRGVFQVQGLALSNGVDAAISGLAGVGHLLVALGVVMLIAALRQSERGQTMRHENLS